MHMTVAIKAFQYVTSFNIWDPDIRINYNKRNLVALSEFIFSLSRFMKFHMKSLNISSII
jgi:hypothetical protein